MKQTYRPARARRPSFLAPLLILSGLLAPAAARAQSAPAAPAVAGAALGVSSITWNWTSSPGATGYRVLSSTGGGNISGDLPATSSSFTLTGLSTNTATAIQVAAFNSSGASTSTLSSVFTAAAQPTGTILLGTVQTQVSLAWAANGNPAGTTYDVSWSTVAGATPIVFSTRSATAGASVYATINDLPGGQTVTFMVDALNADGIASPFDAAVSTFIPLLGGQPAIGAGTFAAGVSSITWQWTASAGAAQYRLFSDTGGAVSPVLSSSTLSFTQTGLSTNTAYTDYVQAFDGTTSTNSSAFTRFTLAAPTTGLTLVSLSTTASTAQLSWGADGNPAGTLYNVEWWSAVSSTIAVSTPATSILLTNLYAGNTLYFTIQAQNGEGVRTNFDSTFFAVVPSTYFPVGLQTAAPLGSQVLTFLAPAAAVTLVVSSATFLSTATLTVQAPSGPIPPVGAGLSVLPSPINLQITAADSSGNLLQPLLPIAIKVAYTGTALGAVDPTTLVLARYDAAHLLWVPLATAKDRSARTLSALTDHLSLFSVLGSAPAQDLASISVGPNPLRPLVNPGQVMTFRNLPAGARLRIFTYLGEKLADVNADGSGIATWDGANRSGTRVASGIYLALIEGSRAKKLLRVAIER